MNTIPKYVYHGADCQNLKDLYNNFIILSPLEKLKLPSTGGGHFGLSTSIDKNNAKKYSNALSCNLVLKIEVNPKAKFLFVNTSGMGVDDYFVDQEIEDFEKKGYDAIMETDVQAEKEIRILNPKMFKPVGLEK